MRFLAVLLVAVLTVPSLALARSSQLPSDPGYVGVELLKPSYAEESSFSSLLIYLTGRLQLPNAARAEIGIPISRVSGSGDSETEFGNLFLGGENRQLEKHYGLDFGFWLPTASDNFSPLLSSVFTDLDRWESLPSDLFAAQLGWSYWHLSPTGAGVRIRVAPTVWIPTEGGDAELFGIYSTHFVYHGERAEVSAGFMGRALLSEEGEFSDRSSHQLEAEATLKAQAARIGFVLMVPMDDDVRDIVDVVFGLQVGAALE